MRAIAIIPVRMGSSRFPGKPLAMIAGRTMLRWVYDAAAAAELVFQVFVATPDREIVEHCEREGMKYILTGAGCRNGTERVNDAMRQFAQRDADEIVVNVQGDEPMIRPGTLNDLARAFTDPAVKIASLFFRPAGAAGFIADTNRVKVLVNGQGDAALFTRTVHQAYLWRSYGQHVGVYAYRREILTELVQLPTAGDLEQVAWMRAGRRIRMVEIPYETAAVDCPGDLAKVIVPEIVPRMR